MADTYRLSWEMQSSPPDSEWHPVERVTEDPWDQYATLRRWAETWEEPVRNVTLEVQVIAPAWRPVTGGELFVGAGEPVPRTHDPRCGAITWCADCEAALAAALGDDNHG